MFENARRSAMAVTLLMALPAFAFSVADRDYWLGQVRQYAELSLALFFVNVVLVAGGITSAIRTRSFFRAALLFAMVVLHPALWVWADLGDGLSELKCVLFWTITLGLASLAVRGFEFQKVAWRGTLFVSLVLTSAIALVSIQSESISYGMTWLFQYVMPPAFLPVIAFGWSLAFASVGRLKGFMLLVEGGLWLCVAAYSAILVWILLKLTASDLGRSLHFLGEALRLS